MSKAKFKDFYKNSYDWDKTYFECACGDHIMHLTFLSSDCELIIGSVGADDEFSFYKGKELNRFYQELCKIYNNKSDSYCFHKNNDNLKLYVYDDSDLYWFELKPIAGDDNYWGIGLNKDQLENLILLLKDRLQKWLEKECVIKTDTWVRVKEIKDMQPKNIDEIGRLHFDLGDSTDIIFNPKDMEQYCGLKCKVSGVNAYIDKDDQLRATFYLDSKECPTVWLYTFTIDMVDII